MQSFVAPLHAKLRIGKSFEMRNALHLISAALAIWEIGRFPNSGEDPNGLFRFSYIHFLNR